MHTINDTPRIALTTYTDYIHALTTYTEYIHALILFTDIWMHSLILSRMTFIHGCIHASYAHNIYGWHTWMHALIVLFTDNVHAYIQKTYMHTCIHACIHACIHTCILHTYHK